MVRAVIVFLNLIILSGCSTPNRQTFNAPLNKNIKSIAIITPPKIEKIAVRIQNHPAGNNGALGAIIAEVDMNNKTNTYNEALVSFKTDWCQLTQKEIIESLQSAGYISKELNIRKEDDDAYISDYPPTTTDAILDYQIYPLQFAAGGNTNYVPTVDMDVRLVDSKTKTILYEEHLAYGLTNSNDFVTFAASKEYKDIDELVAHAKESQDVLKEGIHKIVSRIAQDLRRK